MLEIGDDGYAAIKRTWAKGDKVELNFKLEPRVIVGDHKNAGKVAVMYGPLVLAADEALLGNERLAAQCGKHVHGFDRAGDFAGTGT